MKNSKKGFTLVELLAVIVVLAIIMIIAVPSVLNSMATAKKNSFVIEARKAINLTMQTKQTEDLLNQNTSKTCYTLSEIGLEAGGRYHGYVQYDSTAKAYKVTMSDGTYSVTAKTSSELNSTDAVTESTTQASDTCPQG